MSAPPLLEVRGLSVGFLTGTRGEVRDAVEGVSLTVARGRRVGLVGESGSGKSLTSLAILGLLDAGTTRVSGQVLYQGEDLRAAGPERQRALRGDRMALVFQDPLAAMNPVLRVGAQVVEALTSRRRMRRGEARARAVELLKRVGVPDAEARADAWPHELSGGMRQRACIAMALACDPDLLIADEPTTALDVTVQAQVLDLLGAVQAERGLGILLISHDLGLVAGWCDEVHVMYAGQLVESGAAERVLTRPRHPYTAALLESLPTPGRRRERLPELPGRVPEPGQQLGGCRFHPRCGVATGRCRSEAPAWSTLPDGGVRCHHPMAMASGPSGAVAASHGMDDLSSNELPPPGGAASTGSGTDPQATASDGTRASVPFAASEGEAS